MKSASKRIVSQDSGISRISPLRTLPNLEHEGQVLFPDINLVVVLGQLHCKFPSLAIKQVYVVVRILAVVNWFSRGWWYV